ncbi:MAG: hypothetical protein JSU69_04580 [Candidatus Zixiibacteriota bacterium]|nr:MAG: hypothetical protein JSU69_04580 [candidate division Zixibacteria bacterium]
MKSFAHLEGAKIVAADGTFLGIISTRPFDPDSIANEFGEYGNEFKPKSIFNEFGQYGNRLSSLSPFNPMAAAPPKISRDDRFVAYLTKNSFLSPRIDPDELLSWLRPDR